MSELKHGFGAAKMNKDLDERIVPNGEYRDALNIEVSTSEGSNVGTMQTILGNSSITDKDNLILSDVNNNPNLFSGSARCVGSIADEQNNHIYYFIADPVNHTDYIMRYDSSADKLIPVVVDKYQVEKGIFDINISVGASNPKLYFTIPDDGATNQNVSNVRPGMVIQTNSFEMNNAPISITFDQYFTVTKMERKQLGGSTWWEVYIDVIAPHYDVNSWGNNANDLFEFGISSWPTYPVTGLETVVKFRAKKVLNFCVNADSTHYFPPITGINIIDGVLLWTDGNSEPKKIIVEDFIKEVHEGRAGTWTSGELHSFFNVYSPNMIGVSQPGFPPSSPNSNGLIVDQGIDLRLQPDFLKEEHITVIRKSPLHAPVIIMSNTSDGRFTSANTQANLTSKTDPNSVFVGSDGSNLLIDSIVNIAFQGGANTPDYLAGDLVLLRKSGAFDPSDLAEYELIVEIVEFNTGNNKAKVKIVWIQKNPVNNSVSGTSSNPAPGTTAPNVVTPAVFYSVLKQEKPLYEFKFPKFAFRWKYKDNQYSPYSPFSETAFLPGIFDYVPKEGYNLGMVNTLRSIYITDFVSDSDGIPKDVIEIDILYKESNSTSIYKVKTVKYGEEEWLLEGSAASAGIGPPVLTYNFAQGAHTTGRIQITSEMVRSAVASNQLLRPWDNVPRTAKAQEIVGNRIVYANYLQNYNL